MKFQKNDPVIAKENEKRQEKVKCKPAVPEIVKGKRWNGKIYGSTQYGFYIFLDNAKVNIDSDTAIMLNQYVKEFINWKNN